MYTLEKTFFFEAGHTLEHHDGKCKSPHGHNYGLTITLCNTKINSSGPKKNMLIDFNDVSRLVRPMLDEYFDHKWLNDTLDTDSPTAEYIAFWIYNHLKPQIALLHSVTINETPTNKVIYTERAPAP